MSIAQRFIAGKWLKRAKSRRDEWNGRDQSSQRDLEDYLVSSPAMNRWAIYGCPHCGRKPKKHPMANSFVSQLMHCVFSTKERRPLITPDLYERLIPYIGGIARANKIKLVAAGGVWDHIHLLLSLPKTMDIAKAMQLIKGGSSKWIHDTFLELQSFEWQKGYGAFSISVSEKARTVAYINDQAEHHKHRDFKTEFVMFLDKNGRIRSEICL